MKRTLSLLGVTLFLLAVPAFGDDLPVTRYTGTIILIDGSVPGVTTLTTIEQTNVVGTTLRSSYSTTNGAYSYSGETVTSSEVKVEGNIDPIVQASSKLTVSTGLNTPGQVAFAEDAFSQMSYYVEFLRAGPPTVLNDLIMLNSTVFAQSDGIAVANAGMTIHFGSSVIFNQLASSDGTSDGGLPDVESFSYNDFLSVVSNTIYQVDIKAVAVAGVTLPGTNSASAFVDPTFTIPDPSACQCSIEISPDLAALEGGGASPSPVPEPSPFWLVLTSVLGGVGWHRWRR